MSVPSPSDPRPSPGPTPITPSSRRTAPSRSIGFAPSSASAKDNDWRDREMVQSPANNSTPGHGKGKTDGPGKTIGGFDKKDVKVKEKDKGAKDKEKEKEKEKDKEDKDSKANLAHVPCRFFKQGACTAGANCPFSHSLPEPGKKEICQWFLKGNCKFGHKCALAHVRPGEPMSMDRKNKKDQQREAREKDGGLATPDGKSRPSLPLGTSPPTDSLSSPVAIRSALSSSIQSPPTSTSLGGRHASSPMREPFGPPSAGAGPAAGFGRSPGHGQFASSPSRPSPLSASFSNRPSGLSPGLPGSLALKSSATVAMHSPLRPPTSAGGMFSSSYSHANLPQDRGAAPLSASFADTTSHLNITKAKNIWARSETPEEPLSPRRPIMQSLQRSTEVFMTDDDYEEDHGEDFLPASLNELLTPIERARRLSRRDSQDSHSYGVSPARAGFLSAQWNAGGGAERLAQSAGANLGPANFLQSLWGNDGVDRRRANGDSGNGSGPGTPAGARQPSLLTSTKSPISPNRFSSSISPAKIDSGLGLDYPLRPDPHPSSPSAKVINEHAPGQSLPGGAATALSRLHLQGPVQSPAINDQPPAMNSPGIKITPPVGTVPLPSTSKREDHDDGLFDFDG